MSHLKFALAAGTLVTVLSGAAIGFAHADTATSAPHAAGPVGTTRIATWQDDKKGAFLLMFDDGWPSQWQVAIPELKKRNLIATFYIVPNKPEDKMFEAQWKKEVVDAGMVVGNHTWTHMGIKDLADAEVQIGNTTRYILDNYPGKNPRLISFAQPGGVPWNITPAEQKALFLKYNLIDRPPFNDHGAVYALQTTAQMLALADKAVASGGMEYLVIHGVQRIVPDWHYQDFWALKQDVLFPLLDGLKERTDRGDLWMTDHISEYKYATERTTAKAVVKEGTAGKIAIALTSDADVQLFDEPLTLVTQVPAYWTKVQVQQGDVRTVVVPQNGQAMFQAVPGPDQAVLTPVK